MTHARATDRRPERTRQALLNAFVDLILERGYAAVKSEDVVRRANIGRSTLYAHFGGIDGLLKASLTRPSTRLAQLVDHQETAETITPLLLHFWDQRTRNKAFFLPPIRGLWVRRLAEMIEPRLVCLAQEDGRPPPALPWRFISAQIAEGQIAMVGHWLTLKPTASPATIAGALIDLTVATVAALAPNALQIGPRKSLGGAGNRKR